MSANLSDLVSHRDAWRHAIEIALALSTGDDALYWHHEMKVFDQTFSLVASIDNLAGEIMKARNVIDNAKAEMHAAGRTKAGNDISGL